MARRDRVPRHKSHNQHKNKNPKLSPFQRELKRNRLANQTPTAKTMGTDRDIPKSERLVFEFLQKQRARQAERRQLLLAQREAEERKKSEEKTEQGHDGDEDVRASEAVSSSSPSRVAGSNGNSSNKPNHDSDSDEEIEGIVDEASDDLSDMDDTHEEEAVTAPPAKRVKKKETEAAISPVAARTSKKKPKGLFAQVPSLNDELTSEMGKAVMAFRSRPLASPADGGGDSAESDPDRPRTVDEIIAKKKERKHKRKSEARRERVSERFRALEGELQDMLKKNGKKGKRKNNGQSAEEFNAAFEKKLKEMQVEKRREEERAKKQEKLLLQRKQTGEAVEGHSRGKKNSKGSQREVWEDLSASPSSHADGEAASSASPAKKSISFVDGVDAVSHHAMRYPGDRTAEDTNGNAAAAGSSSSGKKRPRDFYELVDVVRYGERVEAPPVFDVVPNKNAAVTRLANKLSREEAQAAALRRNSSSSRSSSAGPGLVGVRPAASFTHQSSRKSSPSPSSAEERHRMLSSVGGGMGEQKRLARLGLAPAITAPVRLPHDGSGGHSGNDNKKKQKEMELLRDRVMATYRMNKRRDGEKKPGADIMKHQFPQFS